MLRSFVVRASQDTTDSERLVIVACSFIRLSQELQRCHPWNVLMLVLLIIVWLRPGLIFLNWERNVWAPTQKFEAPLGSSPRETKGKTPS